MEQNLKIGDWVKFIGSESDSVGKIEQIGIINVNVRRKNGISYNWHINAVRLATPKEIEEGR